MRKFLSLVLALVMMMSLITINTSAVEFKDGEDITYDEAVDVISTIHVVDGYPDGSFGPKGNLTRGAAAKIICNLILGPTTASQLSADTAPFRDVPVNHDFAGYIAYCQKEGIISGYGDGNFYPAGSLTGNAFMKMLLGALGYDAEIEQYVGPNWTINVAKRAIGIGLDDGLVEEAFNGSRLVTREEAALYAFNTLQADLVEYSSKITANVNGAEVTVGNSDATSRKWDSQRTRVNNIREDDIIQFAEEYFNKLEKKLGTDEFERPAYTWIYDKEEIGTYVDWSLMVEEYTDEVTGRDLYDLLGQALLNDDRMELTYYFNGVEPAANSGLPSWVRRGTADDGSKNITKGNNTLRRSNQDAVGFTARGTLTQVFVDKDVREEIIITSIDTWLSTAGADYSESREIAPMNVWTEEDTETSKTYNVDVQDVPAIEDVVEGEFYLMDISFRDDIDDGEVIDIWEPEMIEDTAITKFSLPNTTSNSNATQVPKEVTADGEVYKKAIRGYYDPEALSAYDNTLLTDRRYNVILDQFGYLIGIELNEGAKNYVFITGFDRPQSNLSVKTADAAAIFLDGTMETIKVNVTDSDKNILAANNANTEAGDYFLPWQNITTALSQDGFHALNRWFTYTKNEAGVYTLKPATRMLAYKNTTDETIKTDNLYLDDNVMYLQSTADNLDGTTTTVNVAHPYAIVHKGAAGNSFVNAALSAFPYTGALNARAYGNDDSVYITVETDIVDTLTGVPGSISGVTGVYTGVQSVEIELNIDDIADERPIDEAYVYAVYDKNNYIIGAVTVGEATGGDAIIAYVTDGVQSERIEDGYYYWEFKAIVDGEEQTLTVKEKYGSVLGTTGSQKTLVSNEAAQLYKSLGAAKAGWDETTNWNAYDGLIELRKDSDGYVVSVKPVAEKDIYSYYGDKYQPGTTNFKGGNNIVAAADPASPVFNNTTQKMDSIGDAKAYRIGMIHEAQLNGHTTWSNAADGDTLVHYYDSAPEVLTLVGRTLYVTGDVTLKDNAGNSPYTTATPYDEGLALASDAKFFVIQRENNKWKTRDFTSPASAVAQVVDADDTVSGKQFNGEVVAIMNGKAQASTVILISYEEIKSGGGGASATGALTGIDIIVDGTGYAAPNINFELEGITAGKSYTVVLQRANADELVWRNVSSKTFKAGTGTPSADGETFTWGVGTLNNTYGYQYRLVCGGIESALFQG